MRGTLGEEMKRNLVFVCVLLLALGCSHGVPVSGNTAERFKSFVIVVDETSGKNRLIIGLFGSPPLLLRKDVIKINGFSLAVHQRGRKEAVYGAGSGEINPNVILDYTDFEKGIIRWTDCTWDPRDPYQDDVPFAEATIEIESNGQVAISRKTLLQPEEASKERIDSLFAEILAESRKDYASDIPALERAHEKVNRNMAHLRNISLNCSEEILTRMQALPHLAGDCVCQHMKNGYLSEVETIKQILREQEIASNHAAKQSKNVQQ